MIPRHWPAMVLSSLEQICYRPSSLYLASVTLATAIRGKGV